MRTIWNGVIDFGTSQVPVGLASARESGDPEFRTLHRDCLTPIKQQRVCPVHRRRLESADTVKGYEVAPGEFVAVEDAELERVTPLAESRRIELLGSVPVADLDPLAIDRPYFLAPSSATVGHAPYALFAGAIHAADVAVICRFHAWGREQLAAIRAHGPGHALILQTLFWAEDVRSHDIDVLLAGVNPARQERASAAATLAKLKGKAKLEKITSSHRPAVQALLEKKLRASKRKTKPRKPRATAGRAARA